MKSYLFVFMINFSISEVIHYHYHGEGSETPKENQHDFFMGGGTYTYKPSYVLYNGDTAVLQSNGKYLNDKL